MTSPSSRPLRKLAVGVALGLALSLAIECGARAWLTAVADWRESWDLEGFVYSPELGWKLKPGFDGNTGFGERRVDPSGLLGADAPQVGHRNTVLVVSDSTGFGNGVSTQDTYAEVLERSLGDAAVINLGVPGYSSEQGKLVLREQLPRLRPKVVIVSFNFNDRRISTAPDGPEQFARSYRAHRARRIHSHVVDWIHAPPSPPESVTVEEAQARVPPDAYRRNLTEIAQMCRAAGARVVFLLLSDDPDALPMLRSGYEALQAGHLDAAIADLERSRALENAYAGLVRKALVEAYRRAGRLEEAERNTNIQLVGSLHGDWVLYSDRDYAAIMREVAAAEGAVLVDGAAALNRDPSVYSDLVHFGARGHAHIAEALRGPVAAALAGPPH